MKANNPKVRPYVRDETSVLVSVRIETDIVTALDKWCKAYPMFNRSIVINRLLYAAVALIDPLSFHDLVSLYHPDPKECNLVFERTPSEARA